MKLRQAQLVINEEEITILLCGLSAAIKAFLGTENHYTGERLLEIADKVQRQAQAHGLDPVAYAKMRRRQEEREGLR